MRFIHRQTRLRRRPKRPFIFSRQTVTATCNVANSGATVTGTATFSPPVYSGTLNLTVGGTEVTCTADFDPPVYSALVEVGLYSKYLQDLLCFSATPTEADFVQFVSDFNDLIDDDSRLTAHDLKFLDQASNDGVLTYYDRDFWIDMIAEKYLTLTGRTFGSATPSTLAEADPLGLRLDTAGILREDVIIIDPDGANETTSAADGPVVVARAGNVCTTPGGLTKDAGGSSNLWSTTGSAYRYQFWTRFADLNEATGASVVRFKDGPDGTVQNQEVTVYIRYSSNHAQVREELVWRKRAAGFHAGKIVVRRYPTDARPVIRMGNSCVDVDGVTLDDISPATVGNINGSTAKPAMITVGDVSTRERYNVWIENLSLVGNRDLVGASGKSFAAKVVSYTGFSSGGMVGNIISGWQFISPDDPNAATHPSLVDTYFNLKGSPLFFCLALDIRCDNFQLVKNHFQGVDPDDWPNATNSAVATIATSQTNAGKLQYTTTGAHGLAPGDIVSISGHTGYTENQKIGQFTVGTVEDTTNFTVTADFTGTGGTGGSVRIVPIQLGIDYGTVSAGTPSTPGLADGLVIRQNKFSGMALSQTVRIRACDNVYVGYNDATGYDSSIILLTDVDNFILEFNRVYDYAQPDYSFERSEHGFQLSYVSNGIVQGNVVYNHHPTENSAGFGIWQKHTSHNVIYKGNILYRSGIYIDIDGASLTNLKDITIYRNLISGFAEDLKTGDYGDYINAPILINMQTPLWTDGGIVSSESTGGGTPKVIFTLTPGHSFEVGDQFTVVSHSVSGYNSVLQQVTAVDLANNKITSTVSYTSSGTGGFWRFSGASAAKSSGQDGTLNGVVTLTENAVWRFENATPDQATIESGPHMSIRDGAGGSDFFAVTDSLTGWVDNVAERPEWLNDPETGDFTLDGTNTYASYFSNKTPFASTLQWDANPLDDFCPLDLGYTCDADATFTAPVYTGTTNVANSGATVTADVTYTNISFTATCDVANTGATVIAIATFATISFNATCSVVNSGATIVALGDSDVPVYTATTNVANTGATVISSGTFTPVAPGDYNATCNVELGSILCDILSSVSNPVDPTIYSALFNSFDITL